MNRVKCTLLSAAIISLYCCQTSKTELKFSVQEKTNLPAIFREYPSTVILKEDNIRMNAVRYALANLSQMDSTVLTSVHYPYPGTNGNFSKLDVRRGEQYNITLPGEDRLFVNAATELLMNFKAGQKTYVLHGKTWFKSVKDSATIQLDSLIVNLAPHSKINIDNYTSDSDIIVSLTEGSAKIIHDGYSYSLLPKWEMTLNRATGKIKTKMFPVDVTSWTVGGFRHWDIPFNSVINEVGRLYNKEVYIENVCGKLRGLDIDYRNTPIEEVAETYNALMPSIILEISGDSLKIFCRPESKKEKPSSNAPQSKIDHQKNNKINRLNQ